MRDVSSRPTLCGLSPGSMSSETSLASQESFRAPSEVIQARFPLLNQRTLSSEGLSAPSWPTTSRPSTTVNPHGYPACLRHSAPSRTVHGLGLNRDMLTTPRCSKSRLHRQRVRAKFSHGLYRPLPRRGGDAVSYSRGYHRLPSGSPIPVNTCRTVRPTCCILTVALTGASRYLVGPGRCALLPRHHSEPKELPLVDHFDAIPRGMGTGYSETTKGFRTGASPHGWAFHLLHRMVTWSLHFYYLAAVTSRHANREGAKDAKNQLLPVSCRKCIFT